MTLSYQEQALQVDLNLDEMESITARWTSESDAHEEPAVITEVRPNTVQVKLESGKLILLPRVHSVRWSPNNGAFLN